jgi:dienelactone hydrolase
MNAYLSTLSEHEVRIPCAGAILRGDVTIPAGATALVVFAHGSGSSRLSPRNRLVAGEMHRRNLATLLFDLLTPEEAILEARSGALRFNIPLLTERLIAATRWAKQDEHVGKMAMGYFGASTGAAAALVAAAQCPEVKAVVSRGGRTDLAGDAIAHVEVPTLLIVGELDFPVIRWNEESLARLPGAKRLTLIKGATHLFGEPSALEEVAALAADWFDVHLTINIKKERSLS